MSIWNAIEDSFDNIRDTVQSFRAIMRDPNNICIRTVRLPQFDSSSTNIPKGSVIKVTRAYAGLPAYEHYGVYISNTSVVHYNSRDGELSGENRVIETPLDGFLKGAIKVYTVQFPKSIHEWRKHKVFQHPTLTAPRWPLPVSPNAAKFHFYSPDEVAQRALERLGEGGYSVFSNNCEHFAVWCATGVKESIQVDWLLEVFSVENVIRT